MGFAPPTLNRRTRLAREFDFHGAEFRGRGWIAAAVEFQYTFVPDSLTGGLADIYDEHDLGGFDVRFKIVIGR